MCSMLQWASGSMLRRPTVGLSASDHLVFKASLAVNCYGCRKIANGHNWRMTQPINGRPLQLGVF
ncbi:hypothetical protein OEZ85_001185 [Tetradesmus obliquus]|uniref:Uncharacterized protein n=1 Tax=Tetradesmus obliquus TaxID=3088 RepID=A0ABY8UP97_TETOB|nr:hypothetical protein OEZ85_001185 [Tetradesmus obliquus]